MNYPIPLRAVQALAMHQAGKGDANPGLLFERFVPDMRHAQGDDRRRALAEIVSAARRADRELLAGWRARWRTVAESAQAEPFVLKTDWRFLTGLGRKGALEVGFTFHRYGFPILPGSSIKGVARACARLALKMRDPHDLDAPPDFETVFGRAPRPGEGEEAAQAGHAIFFDAIPGAMPKLELDLMNPHVPEYYREKGGVAPTNWQSPVPVPFLVVAAQTPFHFAVGWRGPLDAEGRRLRDLAVAWLKDGLTQLGAGAKTSAGYGFFQPETIPAPSRSTASLTASSPPKDLVWKKGRTDKHGRNVIPADAPGQPLAFRADQVLPKGWTPGNKAEVEYAVENLPDGGQRVWVKKPYHLLE